jgi:flagella basal body P-ring formation protein FlgA
MRGPKIFVIGSLAVLAGLFVGTAALSAEKVKTSQEEGVTTAMRAYVADALQIDPAAVTVRIMSSLDGLVLRPVPHISHLGSGSPVGRVTFLMGTARVQAEVEAVKEVVVASRFLRRNQLLEEGDLMMAAIRLTGLAGRYIDNLDLAVGKRVTRSVSARLPITEDVLGKPYMIRQGARITIQYVQGALKVLALGTAKEDGPAGASIRVSNLDSKKDLWARVVDGQTVQVGP